MLGSGGGAPVAVRMTAHCSLKLYRSGTGVVMQEVLGEVATAISLAFGGGGGGELVSGSQSLVTGSILGAGQSW
jgi:hypothetical protein